MTIARALRAPLAALALLGLSSAASLVVTSAAQAQAFPNKPVRLVLP